MPNPEIGMMILTKFFWAFVGSTIALLINPPKGRKEALTRVVVSMSIGWVAGLPLLEKLGLMRTVENEAFSFALAALIAWPLAGAVYRLAAVWKAQD